MFHYIDTASSRAEINVVSAKLKLDKIAIVDLGGTGAYVLDLTAKTHAKEIHLFDGDTFFQHNGDSLGGIVKTTTSTPAQRDHVRAKNRISFAAGDGNNEYDQNIQIADLNALNATLAVIKWKKLFGFYHDLDKEHHCAYTIDGNNLVNEDRASSPWPFEDEGLESSSMSRRPRIRAGTNSMRWSKL